MGFNGLYRLAISGHFFAFLMLILCSKINCWQCLACLALSGHLFILSITDFVFKN